MFTAVFVPETFIIGKLAKYLQLANLHVDAYAKPTHLPRSGTVLTEQECTLHPVRSFLSEDQVVKDTILDMMVINLHSYIYIPKEGALLI